jgi:hypothetical protein
MASIRKRHKEAAMTKKKKIIGERLALSNLDTHHHICDLINFEYPVLSLYSDGRESWIYMWCDRSRTERFRWILFPTSRENLSAYFTKDKSLQVLFRRAEKYWLLDRSGWSDEPASTDDAEKPKTPRRSLMAVGLDQLGDYVPSADSNFDESLSNDLDISKHVVPSKFAVQIKGTWFGEDVQMFFRRFEMLYSFFYATRPQFVRTVRYKLRHLLQMPWTGGFSRVHLYLQLRKEIPALHVLKVSRLQYASPGSLQFEAISNVGKRIREVASLLIKHEDQIMAAAKEVRTILSKNKLSTSDLSRVPESRIPLTAKELEIVIADCAKIATLLEIEEELSILRSEAPNSIVYSKAVVSLVGQLDRLAEFNRQSMLTF